MRDSFKNLSFAQRMGFALQGIGGGLMRESSLRQQASAMALVLAVLAWRRPAPVWWALLLMNCGAVLAAELMNTALEEVLDHLSPDIHPAVKRAKDCAAGAVLVLSLTAVAVFIAFLVASFRTGA